jgi:hypothetical protein
MPPAVKPVFFSVSSGGKGVGIDIAMLVRLTSCGIFKKQLAFFPALVWLCPKAWKVLQSS